MTNGNDDKNKSNGSNDRRIQINEEKGLQAPKVVPDMPKVKAPAAEKKN